MDYNKAKKCGRLRSDAFLLILSFKRQLNGTNRLSLKSFLARVDFSWVFVIKITEKR